ncbi:MAG: acetyl-CoA carboxylase biotin carboxyl carrier protein subunit [Desulfobacterales bacterium]
MRRRIDLLDKPYHVIAFERSGEQRLEVEDADSKIATLIVDDSGEGEIRLGDRSARIQLAIKGETTYIRAFGRTFALRIVDPVEQASQESGDRSNAARAPMPGVVVEVKVAAGDRIVKGQPLMTIESMKILTVISASRDGKVARVNFEQGQTFDKNAALVTLSKEED